LKLLEPLHTQEQILLDEDSAGLLFVGGLGSGKTFILLTKMMIAKLQYPNHDLLLVTPIFALFRDVLIPTITEILDDTEIVFRASKTTGEIFFPNIGRGRVIVKSMDSPATIIGMNVVSVFLDELDTIPLEKAEEVWHRCMARARKSVVRVNIDGSPHLQPNGQPYLDEDGEILKATNQMVVATSPEGFRFCYKMFQKEPPPNYRLIRAKTEDNPYISKSYVANLRAIYPKQLIEAYLNGEFVNLNSGNVYSEYRRDLCESDHIIRIEPTSDSPRDTLHIGIDFNVNNMNGIIFVERKPLLSPPKDYAYAKRNTFHAVHHISGARDTPELIEIIMNKWPLHQIICYPDASGKAVSSKGITLSDISLLKKAGFKVIAPNKNPRIMDRVQSVNSALKTGILKVNSTLCPEVAEALEIQIYNVKTELPEKTSSSENSIDDINDAFGYPIYQIFPLIRKIIKRKKLRGL